MNTDERPGGREHVARQKTAEIKRFSDERLEQFEREKQDRASRRDGYDERPRRFGNDRRDFDDRRGRRDFDDRRDRRDFGERRDRRDFDDRRDRRDGFFRSRDERDENRGFGRRDEGGRRDSDRRYGERRFNDRKFDDDRRESRFGERKYGHHDFDDDERPMRRGFGGRRDGGYRDDWDDRRDRRRGFDDRRDRRDDDRGFGKRFGGRDRKFGGDREERREGGFRRLEKDLAKDVALERPKATGEIRLNKYLADAGVCSRREADNLIVAGAVTVNGEVVTTLGTKVQTTDKVVYGGVTLSREKLRYILLNKPKGIITTSDDPYERHTVMELVEDACEERIYPVGRLDRETLGLLLLTNDGDLATILTHPSHEVAKLYDVTLNKPLTNADFEKIQEGLELEDGPIKVDDIAYVVDDPTKCEIGVEIHSGRNHIVRRIFESLGYEIVKLDRVMYAGLTKKNLPRGHWRFLTSAEISMLKSMK